MSNGIDSLFGPLSKTYCFYFYLLSFGGLFVLIVYTLATLFVGISKKKGPMFYLYAFSVCLVYGMFYLQNRLLYNMCSHSL